MWYQSVRDSITSNLGHLLRASGVFGFFDCDVLLNYVMDFVGRKINLTMWPWVYLWYGKIHIQNP